MSESAPRRKIDELLDRAFKAISEGDHATASGLAERVLSIDRGNTDAEELLAAPVEHGEIRRLTLLFADLVDSTELSTRIGPETYRTVVGLYRERVRDVIDQYGGHIGSTKGDGLLCVFGHPTAHENDVDRAVLAGLDIARDVSRLSDRIQRQFGFEIAVRVGVHRGVAYLDVEQDDVYGLAANMTARVSGLAPPGRVVVSAAVKSLVGDHFELHELPARPVKGIETPVEHYLVIAEGADGVRPGSGPLVGRDRERDRLRESWADVVAGKPATALAFCGEAGIGKSRLTRVAMDLAHEAGAVLVELHGSPFHGDVGLHPIRTLIERRCRIDRASSPTERLDLLTAETQRAGMAADVIPLLAPVLGIPPQAGYEPATADGHRLLDLIAAAARDYLLACAGGGPTLLVAEDLHWFDEDSLDVLAGLLAIRPSRVLVVMSSREPDGLPSEVDLELMTLGPLTDPESDELIVALNPSLTPEARKAVRRRCDGVPLYIDEVVAKLAAQPSDSAESTQVPDSLYEALVARLRSSRNAIRVVEVASIIGSQVDRGLLVRTAGVSEATVDAAIDELIDGRVLEPLDAGTWRFRHELLREVATELTPPSLRRKLHSRVADAMVVPSSVGTTDWRVVAGHYERAERHDEAATAYQRASREAQRRGAIEEARGYLTRGLAEVEHLQPGAERDRHEVALRLRRGFLFSAAEGSWSLNAAADFERCLQLSESGLSNDLLATLTALYGYYSVRADLRRALQVLEAVHRGVSTAEGRSWPTLTAGFGMVDWYRGQFDAARTKLEEAATQLHQVGSAVFAAWFMPNDPIASVHTHLALARFIQGDVGGVQEALTNTRIRCDEVGLPQGPFSLSYARQFEILMHMESGDLSGAYDVAEELISNAQRFGLDSWVLAGTAQRATVAALSALMSESASAATLQPHITTLTTIVSEWRDRDIKSMITTYDGVIARLLIGCGQSDAARDRLDLGLALADETGMRYYDAELLRLRAHTHTDLPTRTDDLNAAIELAREQGAYIFELRSAADAFELLGEPVRQLLLDAVARFPAGSTWPELTRARTLLA